MNSKTNTSNKITSKYPNKQSEGISFEVEAIVQ